MINNDRIVPVTKTDLLTLYGNIFTIAGTSIAAVDAANPNGDFEITEGSGNMLASEPLKTCDFGEDVSAAVVYFIPTYDYVGFSIQGAAVTPAAGSVDVDPDGATLYSATLATGAVTIAKVGF